MDVSIVVPLYNEEESIRLLHRAITEAIVVSFAYLWTMLYRVLPRYRGVPDILGMARSRARANFLDPTSPIACTSVVTRSTFSPGVKRASPTSPFPVRAPVANIASPTD